MLKEFRDFLTRGMITDEKRRHQELLAALRAK
jgi:hypothetical protein